MFEPTWEQEEIMRRTREGNLLGALITFTKDAERHMRRFGFCYADIKTESQRKNALEKLAAVDGFSVYEIEEPNYLYQRAAANLYGALIHIYDTVGSLRPEFFSFTFNQSGCLGGNDGITIEGILKDLDIYSQRIMRIEEMLKKERFFQNRGIGEGLDFSENIPDYSYKAEPHWETEGFYPLFAREAKNVRSACERYIPASRIGYEAALLGTYINEKYPHLAATINNLLVNEKRIGLKAKS